MKNLLLLVLLLITVSCSKDNSLLSGKNNTGQNGSITRFAIKDNFMYAIDLNYVDIFDISNNDNPVQVGSVKVAYGIETIFIYDNYIYLGASNGVYVLNIDNPVQPIALQTIEHHVSCDPVVVQNNFAYSTQRVSASGCGTIWNTSSLVTYDVTQPSNATLVSSIDMVEPYGLAAEGNWLYVCDPGKGGIVVYDISQPGNPIEKTTATINDPRDIITNYPCMIVSTPTKFELYNYSDPLNIYLISVLNLQ